MRHTRKAGWPQCVWQQILPINVNFSLPASRSTAVPEPGQCRRKARHCWRLPQTAEVHSALGTRFAGYRARAPEIGVPENSPATSLFPSGHDVGDSRKPCPRTICMTCGRRSLPPLHLFSIRVAGIFEERDIVRKSSQTVELLPVWLCHLWGMALSETVLPEAYRQAISAAR